MPILASKLYNDMLNFFRNQFGNIILLILFTTFINLICGYILSPNNEQLIILKHNTNINYPAGTNLQQLIQQLSTEQQRILLKLSIANAFSFLIGNVLLIGSLLATIQLVTTHQSANFLKALHLSIPMLPRLLLIIFLSTFLIQLGLLFIIIPGIFLFIIFSLAPIIAINDNLNAIKSLHTSVKLALTNLWLLTPAIMLWFIAKTGIILLSTKLSSISSILSSILLHSLSNFISSLLLIYLYRLYMFLNKIKY